MRGIKINYDSEGDILDVIFSIGTPQKRTAVEVNDNLMLSMDTEFKEVIGITLVSYSKMLKKQLKINLNALPERKRKNLLKLLLTPPISLFLELRGEELKIHSTQLEELIAA